MICLLITAAFLHETFQQQPVQMFMYNIHTELSRRICMCRTILGMLSVGQTDNFRPIRADKILKRNERNLSFFSRFWVANPQTNAHLAELKQEKIYLIQNITDNPVDATVTCSSWQFSLNTLDSRIFESSSSAQKKGKNSANKIFREIEFPGQKARLMK